MGIRFGATIVGMGVLLALEVGPAKADSFMATGQTNFAACASVGQACSNISYNLNIATGPLTPDNSHPGLDNMFLFITAISGEINGVSVSAGPGGDLLASRINYAGPPIIDGSILLSGDGGIFAGFNGGPDSAGGSLFGFDNIFIGTNVCDPQAPNSFTWASWKIVSTPEPSTLQFLSIGLLGLMGLTLLKNRFR